MSKTEALTLQVQYAMFNRRLNDFYTEKMDVIVKNFDDQASFYGKKTEDCVDSKNSIVAKYNSEFQKIYDVRKEQFYNVVAEIQEMQGNQKIAMANIMKVNAVIEDLAASGSYKEYSEKKAEFEGVINTTLNKAEFDKYSELLDNLKDPFEEHYKTAAALADKYDGYQAVIAECEKKLNEITEAAITDFEAIVKYRTNGVAVKKSNVITNLIGKILSIFGGKARFEKEVVKKMESEIAEVEKTNDEIITAVSSQTMSLVSRIEAARAEVNAAYNAAVE
jgi:hypothetical protein